MPPECHRPITKLQDNNNRRQNTIRQNITLDKTIMKIIQTNKTKQPSKENTLLKQHCIVEKSRYTKNNNKLPVII